MMANGYVHPIIDGKVTTLREYALKCTRGLGVCISMRDDPWDSPIPERFEPDTKYHDDKLEAARQALAELPGLSAEICDARAGVEFDAAMASHLKYLREEEVGLRRVKEMLQRVEDWECKAEGLKAYMLEHLQQAVNSNGNYKPEPPIRLTGEQWRERALEKASRDLAYHSLEREKELDRTESRNRWLADLRASLPADHAQ